MDAARDRMQEASAIRRIPLTPLDYHILAAQRHGGGRFACRLSTFMELELAGRVDPAAAQAAFLATLARHPVLTGSLRFSRLWARPYWSVDAHARPGDVAAFSCTDLSNSADWPADADAYLERANDTTWDLRRPPLVRLDLLIGPGDRSRVCLRWPHPLMDAGGAIRLLREAGTAHDDSLAAASDGLPADDEGIDVLGGRSLRQRWRLFQKGRADRRRAGTSATRRSPPAAPTVPGRVRMIHRLGRSGQYDLLKAGAAQWTPPGLHRDGRHLAACVLRALHRLNVQAGREAPSNAIPFPVRPKSIAAPRPVPGNYFVVPTLAVTPGQAENRAALAETVHQQVDAFLRDDGDLRQWAVLWAAGFMRSWQYDLKMRALLRRSPLDSGFSYVHGDAPPRIDRFAGVPVTGMRCGGVVSVPPGWNPVFCRFGDRLTVSLAWVDGHRSEAEARAFADLIEQEVVESSRAQT